jgi:very-short-patch-repair endonuclease
MRVYYASYLKDFARQMRKNPTKGEAELWRALKGDQLLEVDFHRQKPIGKYIADFYSHDVLLVIEVDGASHLNVETLFKDVKKTEYIEGIGITVLRFTDDEVLDKIDSVLDTIKEYIIEFRRKKGEE